MTHFPLYQPVDVDSDSATFFKMFIEKSTPDLITKDYRLFFGWHGYADFRFLNNRSWEVAIDQDVLKRQPQKTAALLRAFAKSDTEDDWKQFLKRHHYQAVTTHPATHDWYLVSQMPPADWVSWGSCNKDGACIDRWLLPPNCSRDEIDRYVISQMLRKDASGYDWDQWARDGYQIRQFDMQNNHRHQHAAHIDDGLAIAK